ncbi:hypothetical protein LJB42_001855 [Komagataella kurtzmanii]|nr:hypothetical protein LJB42_001855 [Komagataella kurtzmanii]
MCPDSEKTSKYLEVRSLLIDKLVEFNEEALKEETDKPRIAILKKKVNELLKGGVVIEKYGLDSYQTQKVLEIVLNVFNGRVFDKNTKLKLINQWLFTYETIEESSIIQIFSCLGVKSYFVQEEKLHIDIQAALLNWALLNHFQWETYDQTVKLMNLLIHYLAYKFVRRSLVLIILLSKNKVFGAQVSFSSLKFCLTLLDKDPDDLSLQLLIMMSSDFSVSITRHQMKTIISTDSKTIKHWESVINVRKLYQSGSNKKVAQSLKQNLTFLQSIWNLTKEEVVPADQLTHSIGILKSQSAHHGYSAETAPDIIELLFALNVSSPDLQVSPIIYSFFKEHNVEEDSSETEELKFLVSKLMKVPDDLLQKLSVWLEYALISNNGQLDPQSKMILTELFPKILIILRYDQRYYLPVVKKVLFGQLGLSVVGVVPVWNWFPYMEAVSAKEFKDEFLEKHSPDYQWLQPLAYSSWNDETISAMVIEKMLDVIFQYNEHTAERYFRLFKLSQFILQAQGSRNIVIPPVLMYELLFSTNSLLMDQCCHLVVRAKNYYNTHELDPFKQLNNAYVMDICNLLWRHRGFSIDQTARGAFLPPEFKQKLSTIQFYQQELEQEFNLFFHPSLLGLITRLVKASSDSKYTGIVRKQQYEEQGLEGFDAFRIELLNGLDLAGFEGISNLLFTSLKSLLGHRIKS